MVQAAQSVHPGRLAHAASLDAAVIQSLDRASSPGKARLVVVEHGDLVSRPQAAIGDPGAHRARADDRDARDLPTGVSDADIRRGFRCLALGEEKVAQRNRLRRRHALGEIRALLCQRFVDRHFDRRFDAAHDPFR